MFPRLTVALMGLIAIAAGLLVLRQQRYELSHDLLTTHSRANETRRELWQLQADLGRRVGPDVLAQAIQRAQLQLEPLTHTPAESR